MGSRILHGREVGQGKQNLAQIKGKRVYKRIARIRGNKSKYRENDGEQVSIFGIPRGKYTIFHIFRFFEFIKP
jgi:hypothetical protein